MISLPDVSTVIWLEGINDFGNAGAEPTAVADGVRDGVKRLRAAVPGVKIFMATLTSSLEQHERRLRVARSRGKTARLQHVHQDLRYF